MRGYFSLDNRWQSISECLIELDRFSGALKRIKGRSLGEFLADPDLQHRAERNLHGALEASMTIGCLLIAATGAELPNNYEELFDRLAEESIISRDVALRLRHLEEFHNILIHGRIDNWQKVYEQLDEVTDFENFAVEIRGYLKGKMAA